MIINCFPKLKKNKNIIILFIIIYKIIAEYYMHIYKHKGKNLIK